MSSKTRTRKTRTSATTGAARTLRSVPDQPATAPVRTDSEDKLWAALHAVPNSTAADLSAAAKIGKSTAQKILVKWAGDGSITRTAGIAEGGRRAADLWAITETSTAADGTAPDGTDISAPADGAPADEGTVEDTAPADTAQAEPTTASADPDHADAADATPAEENLTDAPNTGPTDAAPEDTYDTTADAASSGAAPDDATETASSDGKSARLAPGALRGMVEDHLRDHPVNEFGPTAIAKALGGKSSGAVNNALDKLVADGTAVKTKDKPRRFALAPADWSATPAPAN